ncbi:MAG TPA: DMT family transporter [Bacillota bacterium]|nr:DMT family transporter [Bacillota bacterium]
MFKKLFSGGAVVRPVIVTATLLTSLSSLFIRLANAPSIILVFYRVTIASLLMLPYVIAKCRDELRRVIKTRDMALSLLSGAFLGVHFYLYFQSLKLTSITSAVILVNVEVFFVAFAMLFVLREKISLRGWRGIIVAFIGSVIIALADANSGNDNIIGDLYAFLGAGAMAVYTLIGRVCRRNMSTALYTYILYTSSAVTTFLMAVLSGTPLAGYSGDNILYAALLAILCTLLGHSVFSWGLKFETPAFISIAKLMQPFFAAIVGIVAFREIPSALVVVGGVIVIAGIYDYTKGTSPVSTAPQGNGIKVAENEVSDTDTD